MILNKSDICRYCGGMKLVRWHLIDYRQQAWEEWHPPTCRPANNEMQQAAPENVACSECGLVYDRESLATEL